MYLRDAIAAAKGSEHRETVAAFHDLMGGCEMLAQLCEPLGLEVEPVAEDMRARAYS